MVNSRKCKSELIAELQKLQNKVSLLESALRNLAAKPRAEKEREVRRHLKADIEFIGDFDIIAAKAINVSRGGICFKTKTNLPFELRYKYEGQTITRRAQLVWLKHLNGGGYNLGLQFIKDEPFSQF